MWAQGFETAGAGLVLHVVPAPRDIRGLPHGLLWVVAPGFTKQIELRAHSAGDTLTLLWFGDVYGATQYAVLMPGSPDGVGRVVDDGFVEFPMRLFVPRAGCYVLEVRWPGGAWQASFAAGR